MLTITGGSAAFSRAELMLKVSGHVTLRNDGALPAQILQLSEEQHILIDDEPIGAAGGGRGETVALAPGETIDLVFEAGCGSAATRVSRPIKVTLHAGLRVAYSEDDGATVDDALLWSSASGLMAGEAMAKPLAAIPQPEGAAYDIDFELA